MWSCQRGWGRRSADAASPSPATTRRSSWPTSGSTSPPPLLRLVCSEDFRDPRVAAQALTSTTDELGLELDEFLGVVRQVQPFLLGDETDSPLLHRQGAE